jgi:hypothetical protein
MKNAYTVLSSTLNSKRFTYAIILLFVLQASFVAFTFKYPTLFDEGFHLKIIDAFTQYRTPIIENQPQNLDILRDLAHEGSRFYHYVLSFIYTPVKLVVEDAAARLIAMRLLNVSFVAIGIWAYVKLITEQLGLKRAFGNFILLIFSTTPIFLLLSATVNYDNALFMLSPFFFIAFLRFYDSKKIDVQNLLAFLLLGIIISLIKFTFLAVFVIASVFVLYRIVKGHGKKLGQLSYLQKISIVKSKKTALLLLIPIVLLSFLFVRIYVVNLAQYGTPRPECQKTLGVERCIVNGVIKRNENLLATKDERAADKMSTLGYVGSWASSQLRYMTVVGGLSDSEGITFRISGRLHRLPLYFFWTLLIALPDYDLALDNIVRSRSTGKLYLVDREKAYLLDENSASAFDIGSLSDQFPQMNPGTILSYLTTKSNAPLLAQSNNSVVTKIYVITDGKRVLVENTDVADFTWSNRILKYYDKQLATYSVNLLAGLSLDSSTISNSFATESAEINILDYAQRIRLGSTHPISVGSLGIIPTVGDDFVISLSAPTKLSSLFKVDDLYYYYTGGELQETGNNDIVDEWQNTESVSKIPFLDNRTRTYIDDNLDTTNQEVLLGENIRTFKCGNTVYLVEKFRRKKREAPMSARSIWGVDGYYTISNDDGCAYPSYDLGLSDLIRSRTTGKVYKIDEGNAYLIRNSDDETLWETGEVESQTLPQFDGKSIHYLNVISNY